MSETETEKTETPGVSDEAGHDLGTDNLEAGEQARRTVRRFLDKRRDNLHKIAHVDEDGRPVATISDPDGENVHVLTAADLRELLYWADRGLNSGWRKLAPEGMPHHVDRRGLSEDERERIEYQQLLDIPIEDKCTIVVRGVPSVWYNHFDGGSAVVEAIAQAEHLAEQDQADYTVLTIPRGSLQGIIARYVGVIKKSLNEALKEDTD